MNFLREILEHFKGSSPAQDRERSLTKSHDRGLKLEPDYRSRILLTHSEGVFSFALQRLEIDYPPTQLANELNYAFENNTLYPDYLYALDGLAARITKVPYQISVLRNLFRLITCPLDESEICKGFEFESNEQRTSAVLEKIKDSVFQYFIGKGVHVEKSQISEDFITGELGCFNFNISFEVKKDLFENDIFKVEATTYLGQYGLGTDSDYLSRTSLLNNFMRDNLIRLNLSEGALSANIVCIQARESLNLEELVSYIEVLLTNSILLTDSLVRDSTFKPYISEGHWLEYPSVLFSNVSKFKNVCKESSEKRRLKFMPLLKGRSKNSSVASGEKNSLIWGDLSCPFRVETYGVSLALELNTDFDTAAYSALRLNSIDLFDPKLCSSRIIFGTWYAEPQSDLDHSHKAKWNLAYATEAPFSDSESAEIFIQQIKVLFKGLSKRFISDRAVGYLKFFIDQFSTQLRPGDFYEGRLRITRNQSIDHDSYLEDTKQRDEKCQRYKPLVVKHLLLGQFDQATNLLEEMLGNGCDVDVPELRVFLALAKGEPDQALNELNAINVSNYPIAIFYFGVAHLLKGDQREANYHFARLIDLI